MRAIRSLGQKTAGLIDWGQLTIERQGGEQSVSQEAIAEASVGLYAGSSTATTRGWAIT